MTAPDVTDRKWTISEMPTAERAMAKAAAKRAKMNQAEWLALVIRQAVADERQGGGAKAEILSASGVALMQPLVLSLAQRHEALLLAEHIAAQRDMRLAERVYVEIGRQLAPLLGLPAGSRPFQPRPREK